MPWESCGKDLQTEIETELKGARKMIGEEEEQIKEMNENMTRLRESAKQEIQKNASKRERGAEAITIDENRHARMML